MKRLIVLLSLLATSPLALSTEWFVSPTGSDGTGNGSLALPFRTLTHLLEPSRDLVRAGDVVTLRGPLGNNVYREVEVRLRVPLTLRSYPGEWAVIACPIDQEDTVCVQIDPEASGSRISRLEISGGNLYGLFFQTDWDARNNRSGKGASNVIVEDCSIHDTGRDAVKITPQSNNITIRRCEIYNTGRIYPPGTPLDDKNAEGIDNVNGSGMVVEDSWIHDIATTGLYFKGGAADVIVQRNRIERTGVGGIMVGFDTSPEFFDTAVNPRYYESIRGLVRNNVVRDTGYAGIGLYAAQDAVVVNNTIVNTARQGHAGIYFGVTLQDFEPEAGSPLADGSPLATWQSQLQADARSFSGAISVRADGHLPPGSPAIGKGLALGQVSDGERVMNWAEIAYPQYFRRPFVAGTALGYSFRYYEATRNDLATQPGGGAQRARLDRAGRRRSG